MPTTQDKLPYYSRFEVLTEAKPAWAVDRRAVLFHFDGLCFWRRPCGAAAFKRITSWQAPRYGWFHRVDCACPLCASESRSRRAA